MSVTAVISQTRKTVADLDALGEGPPYAELIGGEITIDLPGFSAALAGIFRE